jgi:hypothetical protein
VLFYQYIFHLLSAPSCYTVHQRHATFACKSTPRSQKDQVTQDRTLSKAQPLAEQEQVVSIECFQDSNTKQSKDSLPSPDGCISFLNTGVLISSCARACCSWSARLWLLCSIQSCCSIAHSAKVQKSMLCDSPHFSLLKHDAAHTTVLRLVACAMFSVCSAIAVAAVLNQEQRAKLCCTIHEL